jgi:hypothetical protein
MGGRIFLSIFLIVLTMVGEILPVSAIPFYNHLCRLDVKIDAPSEVREGEEFSIKVSITTTGEILFSHAILESWRMQGGIKITLYSRKQYYEVLREEYITSPTLLPANYKITKDFNIIAGEAGTEYWIEIEAIYVFGTLVLREKLNDLYIVLYRTEVGYTGPIATGFGNKILVGDGGVEGIHEDVSFYCTKSVKLGISEVVSLQQQQEVLQSQLLTLRLITVLISIIAIVFLILFLIERKRSKSQFPPSPS